MQGHCWSTALLYVVSITGMVSNAWACRTVHVTPYMHNAFGIFCTILALSNFGAMFVFFTWTALPVHLFFGNRIYEEMPGKIVGQIALFCLYGCEYSHIAISFNRLVHIAFPLQGWQFFTKPVTVIIVLLVLFFASLEIVPYFSLEQCYFTFDASTALWNFADTECGRFCTFYIDFLISLVVLGLILVMDIIALILFHRHRSNHLSDRNRSIERKLFVQSICQVVPIFIAIFANHFIGSTQSSDWGLFLSVTVSWAMLHAVDGLVLVAFHSKLLEGIAMKLNKIWSRRFSKLHASSSLNAE